MSERMTNILGYLTLAAILGAIWILFGEDPTRDQGARGERTFTGLADRVNETSTLRLTKKDDSVTLERVDGAWTVQERAGYAADGNKVRSFLRGLAVSERREPKTANAERFDRLGLGVEATRVQLLDDTAGDLLDFRMGTRKENASGRSLTYIFQEKDTRSWLVGGLNEASLDAVEWLEPDVLNIDPARIRSLDINGVQLERALNETEFRVADLADTEVEVASYKRAEPARTLSGLTLDDVEKNGNPLMDPVSNIELVTHGGLVISMIVFEKGEDHWAQVTARHDITIAADGLAGELPSAPEDGAGEAAQISQKTKGWLFKLSSFDANILVQGRADFVETDDEGAATS